MAPSSWKAIKLLLRLLSSGAWCLGLGLVHDYTAAEDTPVLHQRLDHTLPGGLLH
jgi:hypothetical protein